MKTFRLFTAAFFIAAIFAVSAFAQAVQTPIGKVGLINTLAFDDEKTGITKYVQARKSLDTEFRKELDDLSSLVKRIETLEKELAALEAQIKAAQGTSVPISAATQTSYTTKADEYTKLGREWKFKQEDLKERYGRRQDVVMGPISVEIRKAMNEFSKAKGYAMILDGAKLEEAGILMGFDPTYNVTDEFIKFFNARPATTAVKTTTTTPSTVPAKP